MKLSLLLPALLLTGCSLAPTVYRDPVSGKVDQCQATTAIFLGSIGNSQIKSCSDAYERMGWHKQ